jgi:hypothetical protein
MSFMVQINFSIKQLAGNVEQIGSFLVIHNVCSKDRSFFKIMIFGFYPILKSDNIN